jgi:DNA-binding Lrp family transcriptional regulator
MRRRRQDLDAIDLQICERLIEDPRVSNRALAAAVGVTDETVAARIRRLRDDNVLTTTVAVDWDAAGYAAAAQVRIKTDGASAMDLAEALRGDEVHFLAATTGCCDLFLAALAPDLSVLRARLQAMLRHPNIGSTAIDVVVDTVRFELRSLTLPIAPWSPGALPSPAVELDELDGELIELLSNDGHASNREVGRRLGVSDGTVRARIRRLEASGLLRVIAGVDPIATGEIRATAMVFATVDDDQAAAALFGAPGVISGYRCLGSSDVVVQLGAPEEYALDRYIVDGLRQIPGVRTIEVAHVIEVIQHLSHLVRLLPPPSSP